MATNRTDLLLLVAAALIRQAAEDVRQAQPGLAFDRSYLAGQIRGGVLASRKMAAWRGYYKARRRGEPIPAPTTDPLDTQATIIADSIIEQCFAVRPTHQTPSAGGPQVHHSSRQRKTTHKNRKPL